jgi:hypothetical protein
VCIARRIGHGAHQGILEDMGEEEIPAGSGISSVPGP